MDGMRQPPILKRGLVRVIILPLAAIAEIQADFERLMDMPLSAKRFAPYEGSAKC